MSDDEMIGTCEICGADIHESDDYYELPDETLICGNDHDCLIDWAKKFFTKSVYC